jgi:hypothetical protein
MVHPPAANRMTDMCGVDHLSQAIHTSIKDSALFYQSTAFIFIDEYLREQQIAVKERAHPTVPEFTALMIKD